jgi:LacI family transcriptional regulator
MRPGQASGVIGVAITNLANPYYGQFALGVEEVASEYGRRIMLGNTGEDLAREVQLVSDFVGRQVEGLIVVPTGGAADHLRPERLGAIPVVLASRAVDGLDVDTVLLDDTRGAYEATKQMLDAGYRRIGFLGNVVSVSTAGRRYEGYARALVEFGLELDPSLIMRGQQDVRAAELAMETLLRLDVPPTAVFCANNRNTIGALQAIGQLQPSDDAAPALVGFDDVELAHLLRIPLLIVSHDPKDLGAHAARMLFDRLDGGMRAEPSRLVELPVGVGQLRG